MSGPIAVAVVGCGYWGPNLVRNFENLPAASMVSVCDLDADRLEEMKVLYPQAGTFRDFREMLDQENLNAVAVATPPKTHHLIARASLLAGKHTLLEKPMALSSAECIDLMEIATKGRLTFMVGHTYLYSDAVHQISQLIGSGEIGEVIHIDCQRYNTAPSHNEVNVAWDLAPHDLSIILYLLADFPSSVSCKGEGATIGSEDFTEMSLVFGSSRTATIRSSRIGNERVRRITLVGSRKVIVFDDTLRDEKVKVYEASREGAEGPRLGFNLDGLVPSSVLQESVGIEPLGRMCAHFVDCIESGAKPRSAGDQGLQVVNILEASSMSLRQGGKPIHLENPISSLERASWS